MKKKISKQTQTAATQSIHSSAPIVFLCGESPLVEEFARRCTSHGYTVAVREWHSLTENSSVPSSVVLERSIPKTTAVACELSNIDLEQKKKNIQELAKSLPSSTLILSSSVTVTATEQASWIEGKHRLVGLGAFPTLLSKPLLEVAPTIYTPNETMHAVFRFFASIGGAPEIVEDRVGLILPRLLSSFINQMYFALSENIAAPDDIDRAVTLGTSFPKGPIAWAEELTFPHIYATLRALQREISFQRYSIAPFIHRFATTGKWWKNVPIENQEGEKT